MSNNNNWCGFGYISTFDRAENLVPKKYNEDFKVLDFTLSTRKGKGKDGKNTYDNIRVRAVNKRADFIAAHFKNGDVISIGGPLRSGSYVDKAGKKQFVLYVEAENIEFLPVSIQKSTPTAPTTPTANKPSSNANLDIMPANNEFSRIEDADLFDYGEEDEDLPF